MLRCQSISGEGRLENFVLEKLKKATRGKPYTPFKTPDNARRPKINRANPNITVNKKALSILEDLVLFVRHFRHGIAD